MSDTKKRDERIIELQMRSVPLINQAVEFQRSEGGKVKLSLKLVHSPWSLLLKRILPLSDYKNMELDRVGAEILSLCDGRRTVEDIIDVHKDRWMLSFFEARGLVFYFLKELMKRNVVVLLAPPRTGEGPTAA